MVCVVSCDDFYFVNDALLEARAGRVNIFLQRGSPAI